MYELPSRKTLLESSIALVEDLRNPGVHTRNGLEAFSPRFQVCLPYLGLFVWRVGDDDVVADANQALFVTGGETYTVSQPQPGPYGELIITPDPEILVDLVERSEATLPSHPLFRRRSRRVDPVLQRQSAALRWRALHSTLNLIATEDLVLELLRASLRSDASGGGPGPATRRLVGRTKAFLEAHASGPIRLSDVARGVGASAAYLTDAFRRVEGVPLHRYLVQLRLARALVELPHANDLTALALALGFSSHSHFTASFRCAFGSTPSQFRASMSETLRRNPPRSVNGSSPRVARRAQRDGER